jgi:lipopolysaccharide transport system ATP-binding protein
VSDIAIRVEGLSKQYRIGGPQARYKTLRESLVSAAQAPIRRAGKLLRGEAATDHQETIWALKDVSFEVKHGEVLGIIGRNGAGKSTLLKILSRITAPTEGTVDLYGRVGSLLEVGTGFHPELTGRENIYLNGAILGMKRNEIERKFDEIVAFAELEKFLDTPVKHYSSGMYVRLAFAVAAHLDPEILLVDEVLAVGDAAFQKKCLGKMGEVAGEGRTVLFVSHNMAAVQRLCEQTVLIRDGSLAFSGPSEAVVRAYLTQSTKSLGYVIIPVDKGGQTDRFAVRSVRTQRPGSSTPAAEVSLLEGLDVELDYEILRPIVGANVVFHLWNDRGVCVLTTTDVDQEPGSIDTTREPGSYSARCHIPSGCLRAGVYSIGVSSSIPRIQVLADLPDVLSVDVIDTGSVESRISQGRQGVIAPILEWTTRRLDTADLQLGSIE